MCDKPNEVEMVLPANLFRGLNYLTIKRVLALLDERGGDGMHANLVDDRYSLTWTIRV
jgi:hypothetical protein